MRVVVALGGNALLRRGEPMTADVQRKNIMIAARALAPVARRHQLVLTHGNGPQVGLLALQSAAYTAVEAYPLDVLDAQTEGMIGYMIEQELGTLLPDVPLATVLTMIAVDPADPAFANPTKFVGPVYAEAEATQLAAEKGWTFKQDGAKWRRVVPSPLPRRIVELRPIKWLLEHGVVVICAGGGGIPIISSTADGARELEGMEAVIDKDRASALLAGDLEADLLVLATDVDGIYLGWGTPEARLLRRTTPAELRSYPFAAGSMGPKVDAACDFVARTGQRTAIGALADIEQMVAGEAGTLVAAAT
jgi:carbamate kinase